MNHRTWNRPELLKTIGDELKMLITDFHKARQGEWKHVKNMPESRHGGGNYGLAHVFIQALSQQDSTLLKSTIEASTESHPIGFKTEESQLKGGKVLHTKMDISDEWI